MSTAGYTTIGASTEQTGNSNNVNWVGAMVTMPVVGDITKLTVSCANTISSFSARCVIYSGSVGSRGSSVIGRTNIALTTTSFGLVDFPFSSVFSASATTYWLEFDGDGGNGPGGNIGELNYDIGGPTNTSYILSDLGNPQYGSKQYTFYATYNSAISSVLGFNIALV